MAQIIRKFSTGSAVTAAETSLTEETLLNATDITPVVVTTVSPEVGVMPTYDIQDLDKEPISINNHLYDPDEFRENMLGIPLANWKNYYNLKGQEYDEFITDLKDHLNKILDSKTMEVLPSERISNTDGSWGNDGTYHRGNIFGRKSEKDKLNNRSYNVTRYIYAALDSPFIRPWIKPPKYKMEFDKIFKELKHPGIEWETYKATWDNLDPLDNTTHKRNVTNRAKILAAVIKNEANRILNDPTYRRKFSWDENSPWKTRHVNYVTSLLEAAKNLEDGEVTTEDKEKLYELGIDIIKYLDIDDPDTKKPETAVTSRVQPVTENSGSPEIKYDNKFTSALLPWERKPYTFSYNGKTYTGDLISSIINMEGVSDILGPYILNLNMYKLSQDDAQWGSYYNSGYRYGWNLGASFAYDSKGVSKKTPKDTSVWVISKSLFDNSLNKIFIYNPKYDKDGPWEATDIIKSNSNGKYYAIDKLGNAADLGFLITNDKGLTLRPVHYIPNTPGNSENLTGTEIFNKVYTYMDKNEEVTNIGDYKYLSEYITELILRLVNNKLTLSGKGRGVWDKNNNLAIITLSDGRLLRIKLKSGVYPTFSNPNIEYILVGTSALYNKKGGSLNYNIKDGSKHVKQIFNKILTNQSKVSSKDLDTIINNSHVFDKSSYNADNNTITIQNENANLIIPIDDKEKFSIFTENQKELNNNKNKLGEELFNELYQYRLNSENLDIYKVISLMAPLIQKCFDKSFTNAKFNYDEDNNEIIITHNNGKELFIPISDPERILIYNSTVNPVNYSINPDLIPEQLISKKLVGGVLDPAYGTASNAYIIDPAYAVNVDLPPGMNAMIGTEERENQMKAGEMVSNSDLLRLGNSIFDLTTAVGGFVPGLSIASAVGGAASSIADFVIDMNDDRGGYEFWDSFKNLALRLGMDLISIVPGLKVVKAKSALRTIAGIVPHVAGIIQTTNVITDPAQRQSILNTFGKVASLDLGKLSTQDFRNLAFVTRSLLGAKYLTKLVKGGSSKQKTDKYEISGKYTAKNGDVRTITATIKKNDLPKFGQNHNTLRTALKDAANKKGEKITDIKDILVDVHTITRLPIKTRVYEDAPKIVPKKAFEGVLGEGYNWKISDAYLSKHWGPAARLFGTLLEDTNTAATVAAKPKRSTRKSKNSTKKSTEEKAVELVLEKVSEIVKETTPPIVENKNVSKALIPAALTYRNAPLKSIREYYLPFSSLKFTQSAYKAAQVPTSTIKSLTTTKPMKPIKVGKFKLDLYNPDYFNYFWYEMNKKYGKKRPYVYNYNLIGRYQKLITDPLAIKLLLKKRSRVKNLRNNAEDVSYIEHSKLLSAPSSNTLIKKGHNGLQAENNIAEQKDDKTSKLTNPALNFEYYDKNSFLKNKRNVRFSKEPFFALADFFISKRGADKAYDKLLNNTIPNTHYVDKPAKIFGGHSTELYLNSIKNSMASLLNAIGPDINKLILGKQAFLTSNLENEIKAKQSDDTILRQSILNAETVGYANAKGHQEVADANAKSLSSWNISKSLLEANKITDTAKNIKDFMSDIRGLSWKNELASKGVDYQHILKNITDHYNSRILDFNDAELKYFKENDPELFHKYSNDDATFMTEYFKVHKDDEKIYLDKLLNLKTEFENNQYRLDKSFSQNGIPSIYSWKEWENPTEIRKSGGSLTLKEKKELQRAKDEAKLKREELKEAKKSKRDADKEYLKSKRELSKGVLKLINKALQ